MSTPVTLADLNGKALLPLPISTDAASLAGINQTVRRAAVIGATAGDGLWVQNVTTAGAITITLVNGGTIVANVPLGSSYLQVGATAVNMGTTGGSAQSVFYT